MPYMDEEDRQWRMLPEEVYFQCRKLSPSLTLTVHKQYNKVPAKNVLEAILNQLLPYLDYKEAIYLSMVNRRLHRNVRFDLVPHNKKLEFVMKAEMRFERHQSSTGFGNFGCYHCFRIRPPWKFNILLRDFAWRSDGALHISRRICIDCGWELGQYFHDGCLPKEAVRIMTMDERNFWLCMCGKFWNSKEVWLLTEWGMCRKCGCHFRPETIERRTDASDTYALYR